MDVKEIAVMNRHNIAFGYRDAAPTATKIQRAGAVVFKLRWLDASADLRAQADACLSAVASRLHAGYALLDKLEAIVAEMQEAERIAHIAAIRDRRAVAGLSA